MKLYLAVTADKFELPIIVAGSVKEMVRLSGCSKTGILSAISKGNKGTTRGMRFIRIEVPESEEMRGEAMGNGQQDLGKGGKNDEAVQAGHRRH